MSSRRHFYKILEIQGERDRKLAEADSLEELLEKLEEKTGRRSEGILDRLDREQRRRVRYWLRE